MHIQPWKVEEQQRGWEGLVAKGGAAARVHRLAARAAGQRRRARKLLREHVPQRRIGLERLLRPNLRIILRDQTTKGRVEQLVGHELTPDLRDHREGLATPESLGSGYHFSQQLFDHIAGGIGERHAHAIARARRVFLVCRYMFTMFEDNARLVSRISKSHYSVRCPLGHVDQVQT